MVGVISTRGTVLKGHSNRKVEKLRGSKGLKTIWFLSISYTSGCLLSQDSTRLWRGPGIFVFTLTLPFKEKQQCRYLIDLRFVFLLRWQGDILD